MKAHIIAAAAALFAGAPVAVFAQTVDQLVADHALLNAELDRCKQLGMASVDDARCKTARVAENKRFFRNGTTYTPHSVDVFPTAPGINPQPTQQKEPPKPSAPPNG